MTIRIYEENDWCFVDYEAPNRGFTPEDEAEDFLLEFMAFHKNWLIIQVWEFRDGEWSMLYHKENAQSMPEQKIFEKSIDKIKMVQYNKYIR